MLELRNVSKRFRGIVAVDQVSFSARAGEITGYLGPNGSGKSTTMKMITGLLQMTSGEILFDGQPIQLDPIGYKQRIGYVPEEPHLYAHLTGLEYLVMVGQLRGLPRKRPPIASMRLLRLFLTSQRPARAHCIVMIPSVLLIVGAVVGARIVFSIPLDLKANWIFRLMQPAGVKECVAECLAASRRALYGMAVLPVWLVMAVFFFWAWPWRQAAGHLVVLLLLAAVAAELMLYGFQKIPFTCSYLPGKSYFHMAVIAFLGLVFLIVKGYPVERSALEDGRRYMTLIAFLSIAAGAARWRTAARARSEEAGLRFEEEADPVIHELGLYRDGALMIDDRRQQSGLDSAG